MVYRRVSLGMLHQDKILLAILLMRILLKGNTKEPSYQLEVSLLKLQGATISNVILKIV